MRTDTHITISLEYEGRQLDLVIPIQVTVNRLIELLDNMFRSNQVFLPQNWKLDVKGKHLHFDGTDFLADYPVGNGDVFVIVWD
ncbi:MULTISPECIES: EsaB/YukD family protein [Lactococcus]|uniref:Type VII secretion protein, YukD family n=2 Tax=Lactococcus TaxID=1357 RepID=A0A387BJY9_9LACT|nr:MULTISPECIES: EsaB/YukD family protein [Lactococcus]AYG01336.1 hypothetical protein D7I46_09655 [Lactococcus allomyrinae]QDK70187.1 hypothetical protein FLP15_02065 [Lactococcus protaetiae]